MKAKENKRETNYPSPPIIEIDKNLNDKIIEKREYEFQFDNKIYELTISRSEKNIFTFILKERTPEEINKMIYYEQNKQLEELLYLFFVPQGENKKLDEIIFERIETFINKNQISLLKKENMKDSITLIFSLKTQMDDIKIEIKLEKKEKTITDDDKFEILNNKILDLLKQFEDMKNFYEQQLKEKDDEIKKLKEIIEKSKIINTEEEKEEKIEIDYESIKSHIISKKYSYKKILEIDGKIGINDLFEVYHLHNDKNSVYIAAKNKIINDYKANISIYQLLSIDDYIKVKILYGHKEGISFIKYFLNHKENKDYLLSGDVEDMIIVWDILNDYNKVSFIQPNYKQILLGEPIYNSLLLFTEKKNYIYTTTCTNNFNKLYELENGAFVKDVSITYYFKTLYLIIYKYKNNDKILNLIIDCCKDFVVIYNLFNEDIYDKIKTEMTRGDNTYARITCDKDNNEFLTISNERGSIILYDLKKKNIIKCFNLKEEIYTFINLNNDYIICSQSSKDYLRLIDLKKYTINKFIDCDNNIICIKFIILNKKEELIIAAGKKDSKIMLIFPTSSSSSASASYNEGETTPI